MQTIAVVHKSIHTAHKIEIQRRTRAKTSSHAHTPIHSLGDARKRDCYENERPKIKKKQQQQQRL